jgi:uncharacterized YccA/Bax inhibitor family protein
MALFKSGNPALNKETFSKCEKVASDAEVMTISGTVNKTALLLLFTIVAAWVTWNLFFSTHDTELIRVIIICCSIASLAMAFFIAFNKDIAMYLTPIYASLQGFALGGLSAMMESVFPGIVFESLLLTFSVFIALLAIYKLRLIKVTENFKLIVASGTAGIALYYLSSLGFGFFGVELPLIHESTTGGIAFSLFVVAMAAVNLVVDFDFIEHGAELKVPKYMEWYGAFGLLVTIIWLYVEILRLLAKARKK